MKQPQNLSNQSGLPSAFPIDYKNPYDQSGQASIPPPQYGMSFYQSSGDDSQRNSLLTEADARLKIDYDLSSGWYCLLKGWFYFILIYRFVIPIGLIQLSLAIRSLSFRAIITLIQSSLEVAFAIITINVMKHKKLEKAVLAFWLGVINFGFLCLSAWLQIPIFQEAMKELDQDGDLEPSKAEVFLYLTLGGLFSLIGAWRIKCHIEKREAILQKSPDLYHL